MGCDFGFQGSGLCVMTVVGSFRILLTDLTLSRARCSSSRACVTSSRDFDSSLSRCRVDSSNSLQATSVWHPCVSVDICSTAPTTRNSSSRSSIVLSASCNSPSNFACASRNKVNSSAREVASSDHRALSYGHDSCRVTVGSALHFIQTLSNAFFDGLIPVRHQLSADAVRSAHRQAFYRFQIRIVLIRIERGRLRQGFVIHSTQHTFRPFFESSTCLFSLKQSSAMLIDRRPKQRHCGGTPYDSTRSVDGRLLSSYVSLFPVSRR